MDDNTHPSLLLHFLEVTWKTCEASPWSCLSWWLFALTHSPRSVHLAVSIPTTRITYCSSFSLHMSFSSWISFRSSSVCLPTVGFIAKTCQYVCVFGLDLPSRKKNNKQSREAIQASKRVQARAQHQPKKLAKPQLVLGPHC